MKHEVPTSREARPDRRPVALRGFALADGVDADIIVSDLSYEGCQIRSAQHFEIGDELDLRIIGRGGTRGVVCWVAGDCAGIRFVEQD